MAKGEALCALPFRLVLARCPTRSATATPQTSFRVFFPVFVCIKICPSGAQIDPSAIYVLLVRAQVAGLEVLLPVAPGTGLLRGALMHPRTVSASFRLHV